VPFKQTAAAILAPEWRENKELENFRDWKKCGNALRTAKPGAFRAGPDILKWKMP
jgi:hypothetical protein